MMDEITGKNYTLKSVKSEIARLEKSRDKKREKIKQLTKEIKADGIRLKELESIYDTLYHEDLQRQIAAVWFKGKKLTGEQITKFLELSTHISDKIDILDVETVASAITDIYSNQQESEKLTASSDDAEKHTNAISSLQNGYYNTPTEDAYTERIVSDNNAENS